jgi:hypothetical protein
MIQRIAAYAVWLLLVVLPLVACSGSSGGGPGGY